MPKALDLFGPEIVEATNEALWPFRSQIADREQVRCAMALARQKRIAAAESRIRRKHLEGIGEVVATIDADIWHRLGLIHGYETINSPDFLKGLLRDNPEIRVHSRSSKTTLRIAVDWKGKDGDLTAKNAENTKFAVLCYRISPETTMFPFVIFEFFAVK